jgi:cytochrome c2
MDQPMPPLIVSPPSTVSVPAAKTQAGSEFSVAPTPAILAGILGMALVALALGLAWRKQTRWALALVIVGLLVVGAGLASAAGQAATPSSPAAEPASGEAAAGKPAAANAALAQAEYGKVLFVAKGCVTCHANPRIQAALAPVRTNIGKDLTNYVAAPEFLRIWLKDPKSVKPNTEMPNLELKQVEIEALIAFINSPQE